MLTSLLVPLAFTCLLIDQQPQGGDYVNTWQHSLAQTGRDLFNATDLNGDGYTDWLHTDPETPNGSNNLGSLSAICGKSGTLIWKYIGPVSQASVGGAPPIVADLDNDGLTEIIVPMPLAKNGPSYGKGRIAALRGSDGTVIWEKNAPIKRAQFGSGAQVFDFDGDGHMEIVVPSSGIWHTHPEKLHCLSHIGSDLWEFESSAGGRLSTQAIDLDLDGRLELIAKAGGTNSGNIPAAGYLAAIDSQDGTEWWEVTGVVGYERVGTRVEWEDFNSDGVLDFLTLGSGAGSDQKGTIAYFDGATGIENWRLWGKGFQAKLGSVYHLSDLNGDGIRDFILGDPTRNSHDGTVHAIDCSTGNVLWEVNGPLGHATGFGQKLVVDDFFGTGLQQILVGAWSDPLPSLTPMFHGLHLLDGNSGAQLWTHSISFKSMLNSNLTAIDLDQNGTLEIVHSNGGYVRDFGGNETINVGFVQVIDANGAEYWNSQGEDQNDYFGSNVTPADIDGDGHLELIIASHDYSPINLKSRGRLEARDGLDGRSIWLRRGISDSHRFGPYHFLFDLNQDGIQEILHPNKTAHGWNDFSYGEFMALNSSDGSTIWRQEGTDFGTHFPKSFHVTDDIDGDGWDEILTLGQGKITLLAGHGNYHPFISATGDEISVSRGGTITLNFDFPEFAKWHEYRLTVSGHGIGTNYRFGIAIPLIFDSYLDIFMHRELPVNHFRQSHGILDQNGDGRCTVQYLTNEIPVGLIGLQPAFACLARNPWSHWEYCSMPITIKIVP